MPEEHPSEPAFLEDKTSQLLKAAMETPARPLRSDQIDALVVKAVEQRRPVPGWLLGLLGLGPLLVIAGLAYANLSGLHRSGLAELALAIPLVNLAISPIAAGFVVYRLVWRNRRAPQEKK